MLKIRADDLILVFSRDGRLTVVINNKCYTYDVSHKGGWTSVSIGQEQGEKPD